MIKECWKNFFKRFKYFFICFGIILFGFAAAAGIFYGGLTLTLNLQDAELRAKAYEYFSKGFSNIKAVDILSLSIVTKVYKEFLVIAGEDAYNVKVGITLSAIVAVFAVYVAYKSSVGLVNYINKRQLRNKKTKRGFVPFIIKVSIGLAFSLALMILLHLWKWSFIFVLLIYILIDSLEAIFSIRYVYFSNEKLRTFIFSKDFFRVMGLFLIYQYLTIIIASALWFVTPFLSLFVMIPIFAYNETNIQYTIIKTFKNNI